MPHSPLLAAACGFLILNGCTAFETNTKITNAFGKRFRGSKFRRRQGSVKLTRRCLPYKLHRGVVKGNVFYAYKDEKNGVAYIGTEAELSALHGESTKARRCL